MTTSSDKSGSDQAAALAEQQKLAARAPQKPHQPLAAKAKPPETGKPLYDKPHSS